MTLLGRFLIFVLIVVLVSWAIWLVRRVRFWLGFLTGRSARPASRGAERPKATLWRDPVCGTHVSSEIALTLEHAGQVHHFCSAECRERFRSSLPRAASK